MGTSYPSIIANGFDESDAETVPTLPSRIHRRRALGSRTWAASTLALTAIGMSPFWDASESVARASVTSIPHLYFEPDPVNQISEQRAQRDHLFSQIVKYSARAVNWDGDDGIPPHETAVVDAKSFLWSLTPDVSLPNAVYSAGDGEIMFHWRNDDTLVEVGFHGDNTISWFARTNGLLVHEDEPYDCTRPRISDKLQSVLETISSRS